jgi:hypothetical protein
MRSPLSRPEPASDPAPAAIDRRPCPGRGARIGALVVSLGLAACGSVDPRGDIAVDASVRVTDAGAPDAGAVDAGPRPDPDLSLVPGTPDALDAEPSCRPRPADETLRGVSPEGHAWLVTTTTVGRSLVRVLDPAVPTASVSFSLQLARLDALRPWTATTASAVADGAPWAIEDGDRIGLGAPFVLGPDASLCGDLASSGAVSADGRLYEREDDLWLEWTGVAPALGGGATILDRDGACRARGDALWLATGGVATWALAASSLTRTASMPEARAVAVRGDQLLALVDDTLVGRRGDGVGRAHRWRFELGRPERLAAAGRAAWLTIGRALLRFDGADFARADGVDASALGAVEPYAAGGLWYETADAICHLAPAGGVRIDGLRHGAHRTEARAELRARALDGAELVATIDGSTLTPARVVDGTSIYALELGLGWHRIELDPEGGGLGRTVDVKRVPTVVRGFEADVAPIFRAHCADAGCHVVGSPSGAPRLDRIEDWILRADRIRLRVVERSDMPPAATRGPDWGPERVTVIEEWLSGGMRP